MKVGKSKIYEESSQPRSSMFQFVLSNSAVECGAGRGRGMPCWSVVHRITPLLLCVPGRVAGPVSADTAEQSINIADPARISAETPARLEQVFTAGGDNRPDKH